MQKKAIIISVFIVMMFYVLDLVSYPVLAENTRVKVQVNDVLVDFPNQQPYIDRSSGVTYIPIRLTGIALGCSVDWKRATKTIVIQKFNSTDKIELTIGSDTPKLNGLPMANKLDTPARLEFANGNWCTNVPLQFISESLGYNVLWDSEKRLVKISYEPVMGTNELSLDQNKNSGETNMKITMKAEPNTYPLSADKVHITITNNTLIYCFTGKDYSIEYYNGSTWSNLPLSICAATIKVDLLSGESEGFDIYLLKNQYDYHPGRYRVRKTVSTGELEYHLLAEFDLK